MRPCLLALALASTVQAGSIRTQFHGLSGASIAAHEAPPAEFDTVRCLLWQRHPGGTFADGKRYVRTKKKLFAFGAR